MMLAALGGVSGLIWLEWGVRSMARMLCMDVMGRDGGMMGVETYV